MGEPTGFDTEERVLDDARHAYATGGVVGSGLGVELGRDACAFPARVTCACGADLHVTVDLDPKRIEAAVVRVLNDARRRATYTPSSREA
jgi:hypothetical protein